MNFSKYQEWHDTTYTSEQSLPVWAIGLAGETGEVLEIIKKSMRVGKMRKAVDIDKLEEELGDVLWYLTAVASAYDITLEDIANHNIEKIDQKLLEIRADEAE